MIVTRPRQHHCRRSDQLAGMVALVAGLGVGIAGCGGEAPPSTAPSATPTATSSDTGIPEPSDSPTVDPGAAFAKAKPGTKPDVRIEKGGRQVWTGPWDLDFAGLTLVNNRDWLTVKLHFTRMTLFRSEFAGTGDVGDFFAVLFNTDPYREISLVWGDPRGGIVYGAFDRWLLRCNFHPKADRASQTITIRIRRDCFPREPMRAHGYFSSGRLSGPYIWTAYDTTRWTDLASLGETVTVADPAK